MKRFIRIGIAVLFVCTSIGFVIFKFYQEDYKNSLPTQIPEGYKNVAFGTRLSNSSKTKLTLIHFFNPNCPCSKFNTKHFKKIVETYKNKIEFKAYSTEKGEIDFPIPVEFDQNAEMAKLYGVYSTPQAVILDHQGRLIYRGNYNKARYCSNKSSEFVMLAIEKVLHDNSIADIIQLAGKPYGCSIFK